MVHFLWVGCAIGVLVAAGRWIVRPASANVRYVFTLMGLACLAASPVGVAVWVSMGPGGEVFPAAVEGSPGVVSFTSDAPIAQEAPSTVTPDAVDGRDGRTALSLGVLAGYLPWVWVTGSSVMLAVFLVGLAGADRLRRQGRPLERQSQVPALCRQLASSLGIARRVGVAVGERLTSPIVLGILRPVILLPPAALTGLSPEQLEMVLLHELAHIRRWDNLVNLLQRVVESLLFFHPMVWLVSRWVRLERECCCDEVVLAQTHRPKVYAELLAAIASPGIGVSRAAVAMAEGNLIRRIRRILQMDDSSVTLSRRLVGALAAILVASVLLVGAFARQGGVNSQEPSAGESAKREASIKTVALKFDAPDDLDQFVLSGGTWRVMNGELVGTCPGDRSWATCRTSYRRMSSVVIRGRIVPPGKHNLRVWVGPVHLIFNWELADENHFRTHGRLTRSRPHALTPGKAHEIELKQVHGKVVVTVDAKTVYETQAALRGTISLQAALKATIAVEEIRIVGEPDPTARVVPLTKSAPAAAVPAAPTATTPAPKRRHRVPGVHGITGVVLDGSGETVREAWVFIKGSDRSAKTPRMVKTDEKGAFVSGPLAQGKYYVAAFKGESHETKGSKGDPACMLGCHRSVAVTKGGFTSIRLAPLGEEGVDVTLVPPEPYRLEWGLVFVALSPIDLSRGQYKRTSIRFPPDLLGYFFIQPGKPIRLRNLPRGKIHVLATPSDPGPMGFSKSTAVDVEAGKVRQVFLRLQPHPVR